MVSRVGGIACLEYCGEAIAQSVRGEGTVAYEYFEQKSKDMERHQRRLLYSYQGNYSIKSA